MAILLKDMTKDKLDILKDQVDGIREYIGEFNKMHTDFIKENLSNQTLLQYYIEREINENSFLLDYEISQLENFVKTPWYKKLTEKQRETVLRTPCEEAKKILDAYIESDLTILKKIQAEVEKRPRATKDE